MTDFDVLVNSLIIDIELSHKDAHWKANKKHILSNWLDIYQRRGDEESRQKLVAMIKKIQAEL